VESVLLIRELEKEPVYELVEVLRFERGGGMCIGSLPATGSTSYI